jgi:hypothetical protein
MKPGPITMFEFIYLFMLVHPATSADRIYHCWYRDKTLLEYRRPAKDKLKVIVKQVKTEFIEQGIIEGIL